jgi:pimeloyl-ACP methyl ester carboxylesterase
MTGTRHAGAGRARRCPGKEMHMETTSIGRTTSINGMDMYYEDRGHGEPLVLLHGFFGSHRDFAHLFDLDDLGRSYRLIVPDLRGHGRSKNPLPATTHRQGALDLIALLDHLGIERCKAVGISFGGNIMLHVATQEPDRVEAMALVSSPSHFPAEARAIMAATTVETRSDEDWRMMREAHVHGDEQIRRLWRQANAWKDDYEDMSFTPSRLATITARTLLVSGDRDPLYPVSIFVDMYRAIPRSALWVLPGGGHGPVFGPAAVEFARVTRAFLRDELHG